MTTQLNQIVAVHKGAVSQTETKLTRLYHRLQKSTMLTGISRIYRPRDNEGEPLPPESTRVQLTAAAILYETGEVLTRLFDVTATKEYANCEARADVKVEGETETLLRDVPVTYLLFLEKQLTNVHTLVAKLPVLDPAQEWTFDEASASYRAASVETTRTKKIPRNHVKAEATDKHPAQVEVYTEDVVVGYWTKSDFSGALPQSRVNQVLGRVERLQDAVKYARERANSREVHNVEVGRTVFGYLFE